MSRYLSNYLGILGLYTSTVLRKPSLVLESRGPATIVNRRVLVTNTIWFTLWVYGHFFQIHLRWIPVTNSFW
jgi:hypothetical protein